MRDRLDEFAGSTDVVLITFTRPDRLIEYAESYDLTFPTLIDADRTVYRAYGLGRGSFTRVWGWRTMRRYAGILRRTGVGRLQRATEDTRQLGGDFVIAPDGTLAWGFWGEGPDDRPSVDDLIAQARAA